MSGRPSRSRRVWYVGGDREERVEMEDGDVHIKVDNPRGQGSQEATGGQVVQKAIIVERSIFITAAVCLTALCVLLALRTTDRVINYHSAITELQTKYDNLTRERDQWKTSYVNMTLQRDQLKTSYDNMTLERDQLKTSYDNMTLEKKQLQSEINQLKGQITAGERVSAWDNGFDQHLYVVCPNGSAVAQIASEHNNYHEDRMWKVGCKSALEFSDCYWSGFTNDFDQPFDFQCRLNYVMAGMSSHHDNYYEDRRWKYFCCTAPGLTLSRCLKTPEVNDWDADFNWQVPGARDYVTGAASYHHNYYEDRRWSFRYCSAN